MGKAYTEEEKEEIRIRIMEEGVQLFHENGSKTLSIRELTKRVGISQGGFYTFYPDKDALIRDIAGYRSMQKVKLSEENLPESLKDPVNYLISASLILVLDLIVKAEKSTMYKDMIRLILEDMKQNRESFHMNLLNEIFDYWRKNGFSVHADMKGIENTFAACFVLSTYGDCMDKQYLEEEVSLLLKTGLKKYVEVIKNE